MGWHAKSIYNSTQNGNAVSVFTRDAIANGVSANTRRFKNEKVGFGGMPAWADDIATTSAFSILGSGPDFDDTPLLIGLRASAASLYVYSLSGGNLSLESSTLYSSLPGYAGDDTYTPKNACIYHGLIVMTAEKKVSGISTTIALFYSQDKGTTWERVQDIGGGYAIPEITDIGSYNDSETTRAREWCGAQSFPVGGIDANGDYDKTAVWFTGTDYIGRDPSPTENEPMGGQAYLFRATRINESSAWTVEQSRVIYEEWNTRIDPPLSPPGGTHAHCSCIMSGGLAIIFGDSRWHAHVAYAKLDLDNYATATITETKNWHGTWSEDDTVGWKNSPQPVSAVPGKNKCTLFSSDLSYANILKLGDADDAGDDAVWSALSSVPRDTLVGSYYIGYTQLAMKWYPGGGYTHGGNGTLELDPNQLRHYSTAGDEWNLIPTESDHDGITVDLGGTLCVFNATTNKLALAAVPDVYSQQPLLLQPGGTNLLNDVTSRTVPSDTNTRELVNWDSTNGYTHDSDGTPVLGAPSEPPPRSDCVLYEYDANSLSTWNCGQLYLQKSGQTIDSQYYMSLDVLVFNLSKDSAIAMLPGYGPGGAAANWAPQKGFEWKTNSQWQPISRAAPALTTPAVNRCAFYATIGPVSSESSQVRCLLCYAGIYESPISGSAYPLPWPGPREATPSAQPNEIESLPISPSAAWTVAVALRRPLHSTPIDGVLFTIYIDTDDYVEVAWDAANDDIVITPTKAGVAGTAITLAIGIWPREAPISVIISDDGSTGTAFEASAYAMQSGIIQGSIATYSMEASPAFVKMCSHDDTFVHNIEVAGIAHDKTAHSESVRTAELQSHDFLSVADSVVDPYLELHLKLDETSGSTATDSSSNSRDGTLIGSFSMDEYDSKSLDGKFGRCLAKEASAEVVNCGAIGLTGSMDQTISFFLRYDDAFAQFYPVSSRDATVGGLSVKIHSSTLVIVNVGSGNNLATYPDLSDGEWHFIAVTYSASNGELKFYHNTNLILTNTSITGTWTSTVETQLFNYVGQTLLAKVSLDDVRIYSRVNDAEELRILATNPYVVPGGFGLRLGLGMGV